MERRQLRSAWAVAGEPESVPPAAERTASTRASGARRASKAADLRSGKARWWDEEDARSARRAEERPSAAAGARSAGGLTKWAERGAGCGAAMMVVVVQRERHGRG